MISSPAPFAPSLSKGLTSSHVSKEGMGFDRLSPNGIVYG